MQIKIAELARGQWRGILLTLGIPDAALKNKHGPCPLCGGSDRFRWDNKEGRGTFICNQCGAGDGMDLVMKFRNYGYREAASAVGGVIGTVGRIDTAPKILSEQDQRRLIQKLLDTCHPIERGDAVDRYLTARNLDDIVYPLDLLTCEKCWFSDGVYFPAMIAKIRNPEGQVVSLHRTYLGEGRKADVAEPRRLMPGSLPDGAAIRLGPINKSILGISEGIETSLAACYHFAHPVWSAVNATILRKWIPPDGVEEVGIYGDNDKNYTGQSASYQLANRLERLGFKVNVQIPKIEGSDWADEALMRQANRRSPASHH